MPFTITAKGLREQRAKVSAEIRRMADALHTDPKNPRDFTSEEQAGWEKANADHLALTKKIEIAEAADKVEAMDRAPIGDPLAGRTRWPSRGGDGGQLATEQQKTMAFRAWMQYQAGIDSDDEHIEAARVCGVRLHPNCKEFVYHRPTAFKTNQLWYAGGQPPNFRAALSHSPAAGGVTIPEGFVNNLEIAMLAFGGMRQVAEVLTTTTGESMPWPSANDTAQKGRLISENGAISTSATDPTFRAMIMFAYGYTSDFLLIPYALLRDSAFDLPSFAGAALGERLGRVQNDHFTTGDGAAKPKGLMTKATLGVTAASATAIAADELFNLQHSVDPAYRSEGCGWMFHDNILLALRKLKDGMGRYLWQDGLAGGQPDLLLQKPYTVNQSMDSTIATTKKTIAFGQLKKYKIRDVGEVRLKRLDERFADTDQVAFVALSAHDGNLLDATNGASNAPVKYLQQA